MNAEGVLFLELELNYRIALASGVQSSGSVNFCRLFSIIVY